MLHLVRERRAGPPTLVVAAIVLALGACGTSRGAGGEDLPLPSADPVSPYRGATLWLGFEKRSVDYDGHTIFRDASGGPYEGRVVTANGGTVAAVQSDGGRGNAIAFPRRCTAGVACQRALVEISSVPALDPGIRDFEFGARVWLAPDQTTSGSNIVQKGRFGTEGGLWKLQVDSERGEPSCVIGSGALLVTVRSRVPVADSAWHDVVCRRDQEGVSIIVDGTVDRESERGGSVSNRWPIRIGAPGLDDEDDQFHGHVDDVFLTIRPES